MKRFLNLTALLTMFAALSFGIMSCDDGDFTGFIDTSTKTVTASNAYTIVFNANGGGSNVSKAVEKGKNVTCPDGTGLSKSGYLFRGWAKTSSSTDVAYLAGEIFTPKSDMTLYAIWTVPKTITLTFEPNGGSGTRFTETVKEGEQYTMPSKSEWVNGGQYAVGWATSPYATVPTYAKNSKYTFTRDTTLYMVWRIGTGVPYTVFHMKQREYGNELYWDAVEEDTEVRYDKAPGEETEVTSLLEDEDKKATYAGFVVKSIEQKKVSADGSTFIEVKYYRKGKTEIKGFEVKWPDLSDDLHIGQDIKVSTYRNSRVLVFTMTNNELNTTDDTGNKYTWYIDGEDVSSADGADLDNTETAKDVDNKLTLNLDEFDVPGLTDVKYKAGDNFSVYVEWTVAGETLGTSGKPKHSANVYVTVK